MLKKLLKINARKNQTASETLQSSGNEYPSISFFLEENIQSLTNTFGEHSDLTLRRMQVEDGLNAAIVFINSLIDKSILDLHVAKPVQMELEKYSEEIQEGPFDIQRIQLSTSSASVISTFKEITDSLLKGNTIVLFQGCNLALACETSGGERRSVSEPNMENVVRGPREAFNESLQTNLGLVRHRLNTHKLQVELMSLGTISNTPIALLYINKIADAEIVEKVRDRLKQIHVDGVLESLYIEEMIEDRAYTPFPTILSTERPDRVAANLLEGRIAILLEGTPISLVVPATISLFLFSNEDYYQRYDIASFLKLLRTFTFILSFAMPGFYVALLTFHQEMIPTPLLIALTGQREGVPFGAAIEIVIMEITFEILREAGIRLPKTVGTAVSIVGGLVLGQAAVEAGLVAPGTVITVALTAIASFCTPAYNMAIAARLIRFLLLLFSSILGAFGFFFGVILIFTHLNSLRSFGVPYMTPIVPFHKKDWKDLFIRLPWTKIKTRPVEVAKKNSTRMEEE
ncbi:spore germination protein [Paenibacillus sedimenti]|uniref:Spore germination protein n=1 Tax=Paenibacillus sedimenti TaxID=2770274 RepID=A0A926QJR2_9BACL|nr:spore germination protein [Paenibacillus sedimenti]MBD0380739.1 spore germination protein [Paenibacillus sedimenti]